MGERKIETTVTENDNPFPAPNTGPEGNEQNEEAETEQQEEREDDTNSNEE